MKLSLENQQFLKILFEISNKQSIQKAKQHLDNNKPIKALAGVGAGFTALGAGTLGALHNNMIDREFQVPVGFGGATAGGYGLGLLGTAAYMKYRNNKLKSQLKKQ